MELVLTNEQMRRADSATIASGVSSLVLMERAGKAIADLVPCGKPIVVVCGGGNNGGDGYVCARYLLERGEDVEVVSLSERRTPDCQANFERYAGNIVKPFPRKRYAVAVDCIFGTGLSRTVEGIYAMAVEFINGLGAFVVSADVPSGLSDAGLPLGAAVRADLTVAIQAKKFAHLCGDGLDFCGKVRVAEIGIALTEGVRLTDESDVVALFPARKRNVHKGNFGRAAVLAGSRAYTGAPCLAVAGALKTGAGYVQSGVCEGVFPYYIGKYPEAVLSAFPDCNGHFAYDEDALGKLLSASAIAFGMGVGVSEDVYRIASFFLKHYTGKLILDADALNSIATYGSEVLREKRCSVLLTPHRKEFSRLCGRSMEELAENGVAIAEEFARKYGVILLSKSAVSVLTDGKKTLLNATGNGGLAKGGSGDLLAGIVVGLAARAELWQAAACGAYLFGRAGELAAKRLGEYSVQATDVAKTLPEVILSIVK